MKNILRYFIIPENITYVEGINFLKWEEVDNINHDVPTVVFFAESIVQKYKRFVVVYKGMMQQQGGSGSCYNPFKIGMDNNTMPRHMSEWRVFNYTHLLEMCIHIKWGILEDVMGIEFPFMFYWDCTDYSIPGVMLAKLDAIGLGKQSVNCLVYNRKNKILLLN